MITIIIMITGRAARPGKTCLKGSMPAMVSSTVGSSGTSDPLALGVWPLEV